MFWLRQWLLRDLTAGAAKAASAKLELPENAILVGRSLQQVFHPDDGILSAPPISGALRVFYAFAYAVIPTRRCRA
ncbi:hypothetical protein EMIT047CA2_100028 [Pseudomonas soli]